MLGEAWVLSAQKPCLSFPLCRRTTEPWGRGWELPLLFEKAGTALLWGSGPVVPRATPGCEDSQGPVCDCGRSVVSPAQLLGPSPAESRSTC